MITDSRNTEQILEPSAASVKDVVDAQVEANQKAEVADKLSGAKTVDALTNDKDGPQMPGVERGSDALDRAELVADAKAAAVVWKKNPAEAADAIRDVIDPDFDVRTTRDLRFIDAVCTVLNLRHNEANRFQVAAALKAQNIATHEEYPMMLYHRKDKPRVVANEMEKDALGSEWATTPFVGEEE